MLAVRLLYDATQRQIDLAGAAPQHPQKLRRLVVRSMLCSAHPDEGPTHQLVAGIGSATINVEFTIALPYIVKLMQAHPDVAFHINGSLSACMLQDGLSFSQWRLSAKADAKAAEEASVGAPLVLVSDEWVDARSAPEICDELYKVREARVGAVLSLILCIARMRNLVAMDVRIRFSETVPYTFVRSAAEAIQRTVDQGRVDASAAPISPKPRRTPCCVTSRNNRIFIRMDV